MVPTSTAMGKLPKGKIMLNKAIKLVAALGLITAIGTSAAFAGPCSCSRGAGGTTYCNCR